MGQWSLLISHTYTYIYICMYICKSICLCICNYMYIYVYVYVHACIYLYIHANERNMYVYIYIYTILLFEAKNICRKEFPRMHIYIYLFKFIGCKTVPKQTAHPRATKAHTEGFVPPTVSCRTRMHHRQDSCIRVNRLDG